MQNGVGAAKRTGHAISRRIKEATGRVDANVGVGDDESSFGGGRGSRAWLELLDEYIKRFKRFFEKSTFERFGRFEAFLRKFLGLPAKKAPELPKPKPKRVITAPKPVDAEQAARLKAQLQAGRIRAHTSEKFNLRQMDAKRRARTAEREQDDADPQED